jgi:hypothetical protein
MSLGGARGLTDRERRRREKNEVGPKGVEPHNPPLDPLLGLALGFAGLEVCDPSRMTRMGRELYISGVEFWGSILMFFF